jgi:hypothetical protein
LAVGVLGGGRSSVVTWQRGSGKCAQLAVHSLISNPSVRFQQKGGMDSYSRLLFWFSFRRRPTGKALLLAIAVVIAGCDARTKIARVVKLIARNGPISISMNDQVPVMYDVTLF